MNFYRGCEQKTWMENPNGWGFSRAFFGGFLCSSRSFVRPGTSDFWWFLCMLFDVRTRNWMEMNSLLVCFIESNLTTLNDHQVQLLSSLLESHSDVVLYPWLAGKAPLPSEMLNNEMMIMLLRYVNPHHPSLKMNEIPWDTGQIWRNELKFDGFPLSQFSEGIWTDTHQSNSPTRSVVQGHLCGHVEPSTWATWHGLDHLCLGAAGGNDGFFAIFFWNVKGESWHHSKCCNLKLVHCRFLTRDLKRENIREARPKEEAAAVFFCCHFEYRR